MQRKYQLIFAPRTRMEINKICAFIALSSPQGAEIMARNFDRAFDSITNLPHANRVYERRRNPALSVRRHVEWPYLIYYRIDDLHSIVTLHTIRHGSRRQPKRFRP